jgi:hypothetical protein
VALIFTELDVLRFMSFVENLPCGCWFWTGARSRGAGNKKWYGSFWLPSLRQSIRAHRFSCEAIGGMRALEPGEHRDHTCRFSLCVNYECIEIVDRGVNQERKMSQRSRFEAFTSS